MSMDSWGDYHQRRSLPGRVSMEEKILYEHLMQCLDTEFPEEVFSRFIHLFTNGQTYGNPLVVQALQRLVTSSYAEREFKFIFNRSCYIVINRWLMQPHTQELVLKLLDTLENLPNTPSYSRFIRKQHQLLRKFQETEQYHALQRLKQLIANRDLEQFSEQRPLNSLLRRYPFLYSHHLLTVDSTSEQRQQIVSMQEQQQRQFDIDLSRYITSRRRSPQPTHNPTLLSQRQLDQSIHHFAGRVRGNQTYRDLAYQFRSYGFKASSYAQFKHDLYAYLIDAVDPQYGKQRFNQRLCEHLQTTLSHQDNNALDEGLLVRTCRKLLDFLVVEGKHQPNHSTFVDLTSNLGIQGAIALVLKVVLLCDRVKSHVERQFAILFCHYESTTAAEARWLVESLEYLNIAFSLNFRLLNHSS